MAPHHPSLPPSIQPMNKTILFQLGLGKKWTHHPLLIIKFHLPFSWPYFTLHNNSVQGRNATGALHWIPARSHSRPCFCPPCPQSNPILAMHTMVPLSWIPTRSICACRWLGELDSCWIMLLIFHFYHTWTVVQPRVNTTWASKLDLYNNILDHTPISPDKRHLNRMGVSYGNDFSLRVQAFQNFQIFHTPNLPTG